MVDYRLAVATLGLDITDSKVHNGPNTLQVHQNENVGDTNREVLGYNKDLVFTDRIQQTNNTVCKIRYGVF
eukprot:c15236_g1_i1 orf=87-299(+)